MQPVIANDKADAILQVAMLQAAALKAEEGKPQRRLGVVGIPGSGKSHSTICTMPQPIVVEYENQLSDPLIRSKCHAVYPMWDKDFVKNTLKYVGSPQDILIKLFEEHLLKIPLGYSVIFDSGSTISDLIKENLENYMKTSKIADGYWLWAEWARIWKKIFTNFKALQCHGAFIFHESELRDESTQRLEKFSWALQGKEFSHRVPSFCTDFVRQIHEVKVGPDKKTVESETWKWQIKPTPDFPCAKSRKVTRELYINADWNELTK